MSYPDTDKPEFPAGERSTKLDQPPKPNEETKKPFDTSELGRIPCASEEDPPYRGWWVIDPKVP